MEPSDRLESWKEIAAYLGRDIRTAQRWEASEDLPVHRHQHKKRSSVFSLRSEIDVWRASRDAGFFSTPDPLPSEDSHSSSRLRPALLASILGLLVVIATLQTRSGRALPDASVRGVTWDAPRIFDEATRDGGTLERIPMNATADRLALTPDGQTLFVVICRDDGKASLRAIDTKRRSSLWTIDGFGGCPPVAVNAGGDRAIIGDNSEVAIVNTQTRTVNRIATPAATFRDFALARDDRTLFAAALFQGLLEIDLVSGRVLTRNPLPCPVSLALSPVNDLLYVAYQCSGPGGRRGHDAIDVIDTNTGKSLGAIVNLPNVGADLVVSPDGSQLWADGADACWSAHYDRVGCPGDPGSILNVIATADHALLRSLRVGGPDEFGLRLAFTGDGSRVVAGRLATYVISAESLTVVEALPLLLWSNVVLAPDGGLAYAAIGDKESVAVLKVTRHLAPPPGLTARWTADGVYTDTGGGNDIPKEGRGPFAPGRLGQSFEVRRGSAIRVPSPPHLGLAGQMTAMAWIKVSEPGTIMEHSVRDPAGQFGWQLLLDIDGRPALCIGGYEQGECRGPRSRSVSSDTPLTSGSWHHVAFTRTDGKATLFIDGRPVATTFGVKGGFPVAEVLYLRFGSDEAGNRPFRGFLDEIEIYNRSLGPAEVAERVK